MDIEFIGNQKLGIEWRRVKDLDDFEKAISGHKLYRSNFLLVVKHFVHTTA